MANVMVRYYYHLSDKQWRGDKYVGEYKDTNVRGQGTSFVDGEVLDGESGE